MNILCSDKYGGLVSGHKSHITKKSGMEYHEGLVFFLLIFVCLQAAGRDANVLTWMGLSSSVAKSVTETLCFCFRRQTFHLCWHQKSPLRERSGTENQPYWRWPYCAGCSRLVGQWESSGACPHFLQSDARMSSLPWRQQADVSYR